MQTAYQQDLTQGVNGQIAENLHPQVQTRIVPDNASDIPWGCAVQTDGVIADSEAEIYVSDVFIGVAVRDLSSTDETGVYSEKEEFPVLSRGAIWVPVDGDVTPDDDVYIRHRFYTQRIQVVFDIDFVTGNTINGTLFGEAIAAVPFNTDHAQTFSDLVDSIQDSTYTRTLSSNPGTRTIIIVIDEALDDPLGDYLPNTNFTVTGGASQAVDTVTEQYAPSDGSQRGVFRADANNTGSGASAILTTKARFLTSASAGGTAKLDVNLP